MPSASDMQRATRVIARVRKLGIAAKLWWLVALFFVLSLAVNVSDMTRHARELRAERELKTRHLVESAYGIVEHFHAESRAGRLAEPTARQMAMETLRALRYQGSEYFWIHELSDGRVPAMLMHPTLPGLEGRRLDDPVFPPPTSRALGTSGAFETVSEKNLFVVMNDTVRLAGHGFVTYDWPKPLPGGGATPQRFPKLSYVKKFEPWGWVIGSGIYIDDLDTARWRELRRDLVKEALLLLVLALIAWAIGRSILAPVNALQQVIERLRRNPDVDLPLPIDEDNEVGRFAKSFHALINDLRHSRGELAASTRELRSIFEASPVVLAVVVHGRILRANRAMEQMFGVAVASIVGESPRLFFASDAEYQAQKEAIERALAADPGAVLAGEVQLQRQSGERFWANMFTSLIEPVHPERGYLAVIEDIDDRRRAEAELRLSAQAVATMAEGVIVTDAQARIVSVNPAFSRITGYAPESVIGQPASILQSGRHDPEFYRKMWAALRADGSWQGEIWNRNREGRIYPEWLSIAALKDSQGNVGSYVAVFSDISERKAAESKIRFLAEHDALTQLPNRVLFVDRLGQAIFKATRQREMLAVLFIDLDRFKNINDSLGHAIGDDLLRQVAQRLEGALRESDTVSRSGGDEFVVLLPSVGDANAAARATEKIQAIFTRPFHVDRHELVVAASVGVSLFPSDGDNPELLIQAADTAMYHSKENGRNTYHFFTQEMNVRVFERMSLEHKLRQAVEREEFQLHYQAQVCARTGALVGFEALIRWRHPEMGLVSPAKFIPVAEESGLILAIGDWVLRAACRQAKAWHDAGLPRLPVAVNISAIQFRDPRFADRVLAALQETGFSPAYLELELTESIMMSDAEQNIVRLRELKASGLKLSIDDFGTGYSSLSYLKRFPIDKLKIDQSFVRDFARDPEDAAIVTAIITLAGSMGLTTIAEGVETAAVGQALRASGCDEIQGYFFARPQPPADVEQLQRTWDAAAALASLDTAGAS